jgi:hypothetical protein
MPAYIEPVSLSDIIFHTNHPTYRPVAVNMNKIVQANLIISPDRKNAFYQDLCKINLTQGNILNLVNSNYNTSGKIITSVSDICIPELLKEQKNILINDIHNFIYQENSFLGDSRAEDYIDYAFISFVVTAGIVYFMNNDIPLFPKKTIKIHPLDAGIVTAIPNLYRLYKHVKHIRNKENEINKIDYMIADIEEIEKAETAQ